MDAPPAEVWALVSDVTRIGEFSPGDVRGEVDPRAPPGPRWAPSFKGHVKRNGVGPTYWSPCRVTACVPNERLRVLRRHRRRSRSTTGATGSRPKDGGTLVTEYFRLEPDAADLRLYWLVLGPLRGRTNRDGMRTTLERMKAVVESR